MVDDNAPRPPADHEAQLARFISSGRRGDAVKLFMKNMGVPAIFVTMMRFMPVWSKLKAVAHTLPYDAAIMGEDYSLPTKRVASVTVPTLVIGGEKSDVRLRHAVQAVADVLLNAQLRMLEGQSHNVSMEALAPVLEEFFAA